MASLQVMRPLSVSQSIFPRKLRTSPESYFQNRILTSRCSKSSQRLRVFCEAQDSENQSNGEEPPESLFMKELKRRGMTPTSLLEDYRQSNYGLDEEKNLKEERGSPNRNAVSTNVERSLEKQRERSMALNSEGLEGLVPRAKLLLTLGGTFFLGFGPLILIIVVLFSALYFVKLFKYGCALGFFEAATVKNAQVHYFGPAFVHDASKTYLSTPQYIDPYALLEDERISQMAPRLY